MPDLESKPDAPAPGSSPADPLAGLYHMSNTAGLGTQEYTAINPVAVAALLLGFASVLALLSNLLLVIPTAGIACGFIAIHQIRQSNQTQTGRGLAIFGLALALLIGGGRATRDLLNTFRISADEKQMAQTMREFGNFLAAGRYADAYQLSTPRFRQHVTPVDFERGFKRYDADDHLGVLKSVKWNDERMVFETSPDGTAVVTGMALFTYDKDPEPRRLAFSFAKADGKWLIEGLPLFKK